MLKSHTFWLKTTIVFQFLTAALHSLSFINDLQPTNDQEKQLVDLMDNHKLDFGMGFTPTMGNLMLAFSISFFLLFVMAGSLNWFLLAKKVDVAIMRGVIGINVLVFGAMFIATIFLTFIFPIACLGLVFVPALLTYLTLPK